jgi:hypothetical protein
LRVPFGPDIELVIGTANNTPASKVVTIDSIGIYNTVLNVISKVVIKFASVTNLINNNMFLNLADEYPNILFYEMDESLLDDTIRDQIGNPAQYPAVATFDNGVFNGWTSGYLVKGNIEDLLDDIN